MPSPIVKWLAEDDEEYFDDALMTTVGLTHMYDQNSTPNIMNKGDNKFME